MSWGRLLGSEWPRHGWAKGTNKAGGRELTRHSTQSPSLPLIHPHLPISPFSLPSTKSISPHEHCLSLRKNPIRYNRGSDILSSVYKVISISPSPSPLFREIPPLHHSSPFIPARPSGITTPTTHHIGNTQNTQLTSLPRKKTDIHQIHLFVASRLTLIT